MTFDPTRNVSAGDVHRLGRRGFMRELAGGAASAALLLWGAHASAAESFPALRELAAAKGIRFGFALDAAKLSADAAYRELVAARASIVVPENALKWQAVHPKPNRYDFTAADQIASFAAAHRVALRGHTFCWHRALPAWVTQTVTRDTAQAVLTDHIHTVAGRYRDQIVSWDVVNEVMLPDAHLADGWRDTFWYQMLGPRYVEIAFRAAHEAAPHAVLGYNEYGLESDGAHGQAKRAAVLHLLRSLLQRQVPIGALGIQSHLRADDPDSAGPGLASFIAEVRSLGLAMYVTELDVDDSRLSASDDVRDALVATIYRRYLDLVLATANVSTVITWGVWDTPHHAGAVDAHGALAERPLVFGPDGAIKPASWVVAHCFDRAPVMRT